MTEYSGFIKYAEECFYKLLYFISKRGVISSNVYFYYLFVILSFFNLTFFYNSILLVNFSLPVLADGLLQEFERQEVSSGL